jgi:ribosome recycling factor
VDKVKQQLSSIRIGRLDPNILGTVEIKVGFQTLSLNALAQVAAKGANTCAVVPFDSSQM